MDISPGNAMGLCILVCWITNRHAKYEQSLVIHREIPIGNLKISGVTDSYIFDVFEIKPHSTIALLFFSITGYQ
jgi:hypothetical protein